MVARKIEDRYSQIYSNANQEWDNLYKHLRLRVYKRILRVLANLPIRSLVDIGASYGLLVEICNAYGLDAYGVDFPFARIMDFHTTLAHVRDRFIIAQQNQAELLCHKGGLQQQAYSETQTRKRVRRAPLFSIGLQ